MAIERRPRLPDGSFGAIEKVGKGETANDRVERLEAENASLTLALIEKDIRIGTIEAIQAEILLQLLGGVPNE